MQIIFQIKLEGIFPNMTSYLQVNCATFNLAQAHATDLYTMTRGGSADIPDSPAWEEGARLPLTGSSPLHKGRHEQREGETLSLFRLHENKTFFVYSL